MTLATGFAFAAPAAQQDAALQQADQPATTDQAADEINLLISRFEIILLPHRERLHPDMPSAHELFEVPITLARGLGEDARGYVAYFDTAGKPRPGLAPVTIRLADVGKQGVEGFSTSAIRAISTAIRDYFNDQRNIIGVYVEASLPGDRLVVAGTELPPTPSETVQLAISIGEVAQIRTLADGERVSVEQRENVLGPGREPAPDHVHTPILRNSPLQPPAAEGERGDLIRRDLLENYVFRLGRHPGRRVDVAMSPADDRGGVVLDYLVTENKPWLLYAQVSNTGTEQTERLRERFGFMNTQLTNSDDVLSFDYTTAGFEAAHAVLVSYERPWAGCDNLRWSVFGSWSEYTASDVGFAGEDFEGESWSIGGELAYNIYQRRELFIDLVGGARWENIEVDNQAVDIQGEDSLFIPHIGARLERFTHINSTYASAILEWTMSDVSGADEEELERLGRFEPDQDWVLLRWDLSHSFFIEPLLQGAENWNDPSKGMSKLAHELALAFRGQYAFDNRLIPQAEQVVGGLYTVRGYPESVTAGDTALIGSIEYRFHLPKALYSAVDPAKRETGKLFGQPFRYVPLHPYGTADWDLVLKAFFDAGRTVISDPFFFEDDHTLLGAGVGVEFIYKRSLNIRVDWGFVLEEIEELDVNDGSNRVHFVATFLF